MHSALLLSGMKQKSNCRPVTVAEGVVVVSGTTDMYPTTRVPLSADHRGLTIVCFRWRLVRVICLLTRVS